MKQLSFSKKLDEATLNCSDIYEYHFGTDIIKVGIASNPSPSIHIYDVPFRYFVCEYFMGQWDFVPTIYAKSALNAEELLDMGKEIEEVHYFTEALLKDLMERGFWKE